MTENLYFSCFVPSVQLLHCGSLLPCRRIFVSDNLWLHRARQGAWVTRLLDCSSGELQYCCLIFQTCGILDHLKSYTPFVLLDFKLVAVRLTVCINLNDYGYCLSVVDYLIS